MNKKGFLVVLFLFLAVGIFLYGGIYERVYNLYAQPGSSEQITPAIIPLEQPIPTPTPAWNTYTTPINTASISYPPEWEVKELESTAILSGKEGEITIEWGEAAKSSECDQKYHRIIPVSGKMTEICEFIDSEGVGHGSGFSNDISGALHTEVLALIDKPVHENGLQINAILHTLIFPNQKDQKEPVIPELSCKPRPVCLDESPPCNIPENQDMCLE